MTFFIRITAIKIAGANSARIQRSRYGVTTVNGLTSRIIDPIGAPPIGFALLRAFKGGDTQPYPPCFRGARRADVDTDRIAVSAVLRFYLSQTSLTVHDFHRILTDGIEIGLQRRGNGRKNILPRSFVVITRA